MSNTLQLFPITASVLSVDSNIGGYIDRNVKCNRNGYKKGHTDTHAHFKDLVMLREIKYCISLKSVPPTQGTDLINLKSRILFARGEV